MNSECKNTAARRSLREAILSGWFPVKLAFRNLLGNPLRAVLTAAGMIAAATLAAWTVASYDGTLAEMEAESIAGLLGKYDFYLMPRKEKLRAEQAGFLRPGGEIPEGIAFLDRFCTLEVTCRTASGESRRRGGPPDPRRDLPGQGHPSQQKNPPAAPPPLKGLPGGILPLSGTDAETPPRPLHSGSWLKTAEKSSAENAPPPCVLSSSLAQRLNLQINDRLAVGSFAGSFPLQVTGIMEDAGKNGGKELWKTFDAEFQRPELNGIFVRWETAEKIAGGKLKASHAAGKYAAGKKMTGISRWQDAAMLSVDAGMLLKAKQQSSTADSRIRLQSWTAIGISLLIAFFMIFTSLSMGVEERVRQYALLRSIALTRRQLVLTLLSESILYGLIGWAGGLAAGGILLEFFSDATILRHPLQQFAPLRLIGLRSILLTGCCSVLGAIAAAGLPAWRASRLDILEARNPLQCRNRRHFSAWLCGPGILLPLLQVWIITQPGIPEMSRVRLYSLVGCPLTVLGFVLITPGILLLAQRLLTRPLAFLFRLPPSFLRSQLDANLWRSTGTVIALSLGLGFYMMIVIWSASLLKPFLPGDWLPDLFISIVPGGIRQPDLDLVQQLPGLKAGRCLPAAVEQCPLAEDITGSRIRQNVIRQSNVTLIGMPVAAAYGGTEPLLEFPFCTDRKKALEQLAGDGNYCLIPSFFSELSGLHTGDPLQLISPDDPLQTIRYEIAGIIRLEGWHWFSKFSGTRRHYGRTAALIFASEKSVRKNFNLSRVNYLWADQAADWDEAAFRRGLEKITRDQAGQSFHVTARGEGMIREETIQLTSRAALQQSILQRSSDVISGMLRMPAVLLWIMSLTVTHTAMASIRVRRREIGIMRAAGLSGGGLVRLLLCEAVLIGLSATLLSLAYGIFSGLCSAKMATFISFFGGMGWNFSLPWMGIVKGALLTVSLCLAAALIPALLTLRISPLQLLKDNS